MAALVITEADVQLASISGAKIETIQLGETMTAGQPYFKDANASNKAKKAQCDDSAGKVAVGVLIKGGATDEYGIGITSGTFQPGVSLTKGVSYYLGKTAGEIVPFADLVSGDTIVHLFRASSTTDAQLLIDVTDIVM